MPTISREKRDELHKDFAYNDKDKDGRIDLVEFRALLTDLEAEVSDQESRVGFQTVDSDHDGAIDFEEFVGWWTSD